MTTPREKLYTEGSYVAAERADDQLRDLRGELERVRQQLAEAERHIDSGWEVFRKSKEYVELKRERDEALAELEARCRREVGLVALSHKNEQRVSRLRQALEDERGRNCWCDFGHENKKCAMCDRVDTVLKEIK
jgi:paraquat-inducible protein B